jgi:heavy metal sensor kinase
LFGESTKFYYAIWMQGSAPIARSPNAPADLPRPGRTEAATRDRSGSWRESFIFAAPVDCVLVGCSLADEENAILFHGALLATAGGILLFLGLLGGGWLVAKAIRPVKEISNTAARIAAGDLTQRIRETGDQSELDLLSVTLNQTFSRLENSFAQQQRFTADAAHELRTPLTVLLTQIQSTLARTRGAAEYREALEACQDPAQRMRRLLESLLQLARLDAREEPPRRQDFDVAVAAQDCVELLAPVARERGIMLQCDGTSKIIHGDPDQMGQAITNLLHNGMQHTPRGGRVTIRVSSEGEFTVIEVSDTGSGIADADLPHLFERFYRADKSRACPDGRTGLGLAITKAIVEAHGGSIIARNEAGKGAAFVVRL